MNIFYEPDINPEIIALSEEESVHAARVLRLKIHDPVVVVDGKGSWCEAVISKVSLKHCELKINHITREYEKRNYHLHMAVAPTKNADRIEWFVEKATEIGIDMITPLVCQFSERKNVNNSRLAKIAVAAMKQSKKAYLPEINDITPFNQFIGRPFSGKKFIAHCLPSEKIHLIDEVRKGDEVIILIGPEGDFSKEEIQLAIQHGFREISLGNSRLRTETAALTACHTVFLINYL